MKLIIEQNANSESVNSSAERSNFSTPSGAVLMVTPPIGEKFWLFRVKVGYGQAIVGFPKFSTIGIGFQKEKDWNTNLPYRCPAEDIFDHISHNKGDKRIKKKDCVEAIKMIQEQCHTLKGTDPIKDAIAVSA